MADSHACPTKPGVELADIVRRFGSNYTTKCGTAMMPSHKRALSDIVACCTRELGGRLFAAVPAEVWNREWVSFVKHYGHGNNAVLRYLSRYVFRTAISNARILGMDQTHVTFRWKDRKADAWRIERLPGVEFLRRFLQHVLPRGFHKVRYYGLWHASKRTESNRAWVLLILETSSDAIQPAKLADLLEAMGQSIEDKDQALGDADDGERLCPHCPHCNSSRTRFLGEYRRGCVP